jgi:hypothetical protein
MDEEGLSWDEVWMTYSLVHIRRIVHSSVNAVLVTDLYITGESAHLPSYFSITLQ